MYVSIVVRGSINENSHNHTFPCNNNSNIILSGNRFENNEKFIMVTFYPNNNCFTNFFNTIFIRKINEDDLSILY